MSLSNWIKKLLAAGANEPDEGGTVTSEWYDEAHTVIVQRFEGKWRYRDAYFDLIEIKNRIDESPHLVDVIFDLRKSVRLPFVLWLSMRMPYLWFRHKWAKNIHRMVVVGGGSQANDLKFARKRIAPGTMKFFRWVETIEEAEEQLRTWRLFEDEDGAP